MHRNIRLAIIATLSAATLGSSGALASTPAAPSAEPTTPQTGNRCPGATLRPNRHDLTAVADATICLINRARSARHIPALEANAALDSSAAQHSLEMHADRFFGHDSASGQTPREQVLASSYGDGASHVAAGQAVAWGSGSEATPRATVLAWIASPPHRALLLSSAYQAIGVGASLGSPRGSRRGALYTADFANRHLDSVPRDGKLPDRRSEG